ncbi:MAG: Ig-like domain-containing protein, partial [Acidimicrobiia bacterium]|nr:Ig-like domain-containing protein [Acidimicrobiia bacterium]
MKARSRVARLSAFLLMTAYFGTAMAVPSQAGPCSATTISVQRVSASVMYVDTGISPQLRGSYVGYKITNSGAPITDVWVDVINFTGGVVNKAQYEDGRNHVGAMSTGAVAYAYFYLSASGSTATPQRHDVAVYSGHPGLGGVQVCTTNFTIQTVSETIKANANKVQTVVAGPNPAELGGLMTMTVTGQTGQVGEGPPGHPNGLGVFVGTPATEPGWRADAYQLVDVVMTFVGKGTYNDVLVVSGLNGSNHDYTAVYTFAAVGTTLAPTSVTPVNYIASGTQVKHTDTSGYTASLAPILPSKNKLLLDKSVSPTQLPAIGGTVIYTVTITNTGTVAGVLDDIIDTLPTGAAYVPGSALFKGSVISDPYITGQKLSFVGFFGAAPGGGTSKLTYSATLPGVAGTYVNSATGHVGVEPIDTTFDTTSLSPATATVQVGVLEAPPVANDDSANTSEDIAKIIDVLANDSDPNGNIDPTKVTVTVDPSQGTATPNPDGTITYTPALNTNGADSFTYRVCDTTSPTPLCDTATVTVNVVAVDDPPNAVDDTVDTDKNTAATWNLVVNDTDPENNLDPTTLDVLSGPTKGNLVNNGNGTVTYTPNTGYSGADSFTYEVCDTSSPTPLCNTATVSITVNSVNEPPVANADAISTAEDVAVTIDVATNDTDPDGNLDPTSVRIPAGKGPSNGTAVVNPDGTITYTPAANYFGTDTFEYEICDTGDPVLCSTTSAIVTTTVVQVDDPPAAVDENQSGSEDTPKTWTLSATDPDGNLSWATLSVIDGPDNGTLTLHGSGSVTYAPAQDYNGPDSFTYQVCDTTGLCDTATVSISVVAVPDPPVANGDSVKTNEGTQATWNVAANDTDPDGDLDLDSITIVTAPTNGTVDSIGTGTITYTPTGAGTDSLVYRICDSTPTCVTATVNITIDNLPDPPVAIDEAVGTDEDTPRTWTLSASDVDGNLDWNTLSVVSGPSNGTLDLNGSGSVTYTPTQDYYGSDSFTYQVCDTTGLCDSATVSLTVNPQPDPPVARNDSASTGEDNAVTIDVIANDSDADGDLVPGSVTAPATTANGGTLTNHLDGTLTYTPAAHFNGTDTFTYQVCDSTPTCVTVSVSVSVAAVNDVPTPQDDAFTIDEDDPATLLDLADNDTDPDGNGDIDLTSLTILSGPGNGTVTNHLNGTVAYTPAADFNGTDTIVYQICDAAGECGTATATIVVGPVADPPVAKDDAVTTPEDTAVTVDVSTNDSDLDGDLDPTTVAIVTTPAKGTGVSNGNGTITYTPAADDSGAYTIVYQICDETAP